ncbi:MAG: SCO family protein [Ignavibacteriaceae bacterium]
MRIKFFSILITGIIISVQSITFSDSRIEVGIDEQLGSVIPLDVPFKDSEGNDITIKELLSEKKATVIAFVYYRCPAICSPMLFEIADVINNSDLELGYDYNIVSISIDEFETPDIAAEKKKSFLSFIDKKITENSWKFLTGDSVSIKTVTDAAGFYFLRDGEKFKHTGALIFINNEGKICRYLFPGYQDRTGFNILPFDFKMAVLETEQGKVTPTIARVLQFCFSYDPEGKGYVLDITRIFGAGIVLLAAIFFIVILIKPKKAFIKAR